MSSASADAPRAGEGVAHDALDTESGADTDLGGDLVGVPTRTAPPLPTLRALGALAHNDEVDAVRTTSSDGQGLATPGAELRGAQVHKVIEGEAQREQDATLEDAAGDGRVTDGAEQDRVLAA